MSFVQFTPPLTTMWLYNIIPKTSSLLAAIHLFISSHDEIEGFCSMDKKTGRRYVRRVRIVTIVYACVRIRNGGFYESRRHICRSYNLHPHQQRCAYTISPQKTQPSWRRYTFLRVRLRNRRFLPHPQKNWSPLRVACAYFTYIMPVQFASPPTTLIT